MLLRENGRLSVGWARKDAQQVLVERNIHLLRNSQFSTLSHFKNLPLNIAVVNDGLLREDLYYVNSGWNIDAYSSDFSIYLLKASGKPLSSNS